MRQDDLIVRQGDDWAMEWPVLGSDGDPLNVATGYTVKAQVRPNARSTTVLHEWTGPSSTAELVGTALTLKIPAATSAAWAAGWGGVYDIELTETSSGRVARIAQGSIQLDPEVTR